jgi:hypothetical protein
MSWNLEELRQSVELRLGTDRRRALSESLESIVDRFQHAEYHISEFEALERQAVEGRLTLDLMVEIFNFDETRLGDISLRASAHALAAVQAIHSVSDIAGVAIVLALTDEKEWRGYLRQVCSRFSTLCSTLKPFVDALRQNNDYIYLEALVNQSKHRNIVKARLNADLSGKQRNCYEFVQFERECVIYPPREIKGFLVDEYNRQAKIIFEIGRELNRIAFKLRP